MSTNELAPFDALVLMSFGGPEKEADVLPFLKNVTAGRGIPDERLVEVGEHYYGFGGRSPINEQNRELLSALRSELERRGVTTPILWGNRNWDPFLSDVVREFAATKPGTRFLAIDTSAYSSYSSCRQYREDFAQTVATLGAEGVEIAFDKIRQYYNHPGFAKAQLGCVRRGLSELSELTGGLEPSTQRVLFVTHSIPDVMQDASAVMTAGYKGQHEQLIDWIAGELGAELPLQPELVYCSRSGSPHVPWLEPDINDRLEELAAEGITGVLVVPIGFVSDHMEVKYDLDTEAAETARVLQLAYVRADSVGVNEHFVSGLVDEAFERAAQLRGESPDAPAVTPEGPLVPGSGACSVSCCAGVRERAICPVWPAPGE
ncbi:ferrochelatase [Lysinibacter cavernae]|uniref:Coproporphyrin III ferrochelatase n=1 Tax=Lysinibacter cavernae TaxID=1640652 RepID=A0A7X5R031_9MICO|nr:ferrochelatase [Lysinibacter cavernae]NIH52967.1 ferrochelatase [Lysinibacter cavernae]